MIDKIKIFAVNMKRKREELKKTQRGLALEIGVTPATISAYEKQIKFPSLEIALAICEALGCTLDEMCGIEKEIDKKELTYTDIITQIMNIAECFDFYIVEGVTHTEGYSVDGTSLLINNKLIQQFLKDWYKIRTLYLNNTIDDELYTAWQEKKMREYNIVINSVDDPERLPF